MNQEPLRRFVRALRQTTDAERGSPDDDAHLLHRFLRDGDANAFELLLWRHGPMVLGVCRRLLRDEHEAEDAFQATFLALLKKGNSIATGAALGGWLYRVAYRAALRLRAAQARRARREQPGADELPCPALGPPGDEDFRSVLDEEVNRLPARHRAAFVLCCLEGKSGAEAARELGCPPGTVSSRLTRAREQLRRRLTRRGLAPSAIALSAALAGESLAASLPVNLVQSTLEAARLFAAGAAAGGPLSSQAITVAEGVLRAMSLTRLKAVTLLMLVVALLAAGVTFTRPGAEAAPGEGAKRNDPPAPAQKREPGNAGDTKGVPVEVVKPEPGGLKRTATERCTVQAYGRVDVFPRVPGVLKALNVDIGDRVKKGQLLAEIDAPLLVLEEKQAAVTVRQADSKVREAQAGIRAARAGVQVAKGMISQREAELQAARAQLAYRQREYDRLKRLVETGTVDNRLLDEKGGQLEAAKGQVTVAQVALENAKGDVEAQQGKLAAAEAALQTARYNLDASRIALEKAQTLLGFTQVVAQFDGVVTQRNFFAGDYVRGSEPSNQRPLLTVERIDRLRLVGEFAEPLALSVEPGLPAEVGVDALPGVRIDCKVSRISYGLDPKTKTMRVELDVPNPKGLLRPGMTATATVHLPNNTRGLLRIPVTALAGRVVAHPPGGKMPGGPGGLRFPGGFAGGPPMPGAGPFDPQKVWVYVVRDGKAHRTPVKIGADDGAEVEITSGLRPTDLVVRSAAELEERSVTRREVPAVIPVRVKDKVDRPE